MRTNINLLALIVLMTGVFSTVFSQNVAINTDGSTPHASSLLDVKSTDKGILIPRLDIDDLSTAAPVTGPATGLMAYNTNTTTGAGFYYWDGSEANGCV